MGQRRGAGLVQPAFHIIEHHSSASVLDEIAGEVTAEADIERFAIATLRGYFPLTRGGVKAILIPSVFRIDKAFPISQVSLPFSISMMNRIPVPDVRARSFCVTPILLRVSRISLPILFYFWISLGGKIFPLGKSPIEQTLLPQLLDFSADSLPASGDRLTIELIPELQHPCSSRCLLNSSRIASHSECPSAISCMSASVSAFDPFWCRVISRSVIAFVKEARLESLSIIAYRSSHSCPRIRLHFSRERRISEKN